MAYRIPAIFNLLVGIFNAAFSVTAMKEYDMSDMKNGKMDGRYFEKIYNQYIAVTFLFVTAVILISRMFAVLFLKKDFYDSWRYIPLLLCSYAIGNLQAYYTNLFSGMKKTKWISAAALMGAVTNVALNLYLIPKYQAYGAAVSTIASYFAVYNVMLVGIRRNILMKQSEGRVFASIGSILVISVLYISRPRYAWGVIWLLVLLLIAVYRIEIKDGFNRLKYFLRICRRKYKRG